MLALAAPATVKLLPAAKVPVVKPVQYYVDWHCKDGISKGRLTSTDYECARDYMDKLCRIDQEYQLNEYAFVQLKSSAGIVYWTYC
jgi:hypothetical protein